MPSCQYCLRFFSRQSNCLRHEKTQHQQNNEDASLGLSRGILPGKLNYSEEDENSFTTEDSYDDTENDTDYDDTDDDNDDTDDEVDDDDDDDYEDDDDTDDDDDDDDIWDLFISEIWQDMSDDYEEEVEKLEESGLSRATAEVRAYNSLLRDLRKSLRGKYLDTLWLLHKLKKDPIHKKILSTKRKLEDEENFSEDEAWNYAVKKRKYLIYKEKLPKQEDNEEH